MISNIGGTLGLFCGFSIISALEVVYWAAKAISGAFEDNGKQERKKKRRNRK